MKRKLWIVLAMAVLIAAVWSGTAGAENEFTLQPESIHLMPGESKSISWTTSYVPVNIRIGYYNDSGNFISVYELDDDDTVLKNSMSQTIKYADAYTSDQWVVKAMTPGYNTIDSRKFTVSHTERQFTVQPTGGTVNPTHAGIMLHWETNFEPRQIVFRCWTSNDSFFDIDALSKENGDDITKSMSYLLPYDDLRTSEGWEILAYYNTTYTYVTSNSFAITRAPRKFTKEPSDSIPIALNGSATLTWTTNYPTVKSEIRRFGATGLELVATLGSAGANAAQSYNLVYSQTTPGQYFLIRDYYSDTKYLETGFHPQPAAGITIAPTQVEVNPLSVSRIIWGAVTATKIEVWSDRYGMDLNYQTLEATLDKNATLYDIPWSIEEKNYNLWLKVFTSDTGFYFSNLINVTNIEPEFTVTGIPENRHISLEPDEGYVVHFSSNFTPTRIEVWSGDLLGTVRVKSDQLSGTATAFEVKYAFGEDVCFYAYYGDGEKDYAYDWVAINHGERKFTLQPTDVLTAVGSAEVSWRTNFVPTKIEITTSVGIPPLYLEYEHVIVATYGPATVSATLTVDNSGVYAVRAYYRDYKGEGFVTSHGIFIHGTSDPTFIGQPQDGYCFIDEPYLLSWSTNFTPSRSEVGYIDDTGWHLVESMSAGQCVNHELSYDKVIEGKIWQVRAYSNAGYVTSNTFNIHKYNEYHAGAEFTQSPSNITIDPGLSKTISWSTNFLPYRVEIIYIKNNKTYSFDMLTNNLSMDMSYELSYDNITSADEWLIKAYHKLGDVCFSQSFSVIKALPKFKSQIDSGTITPDGSLSLNWVTNFLPVKVEIGYKTDESWESVSTLTNNINRGMSFMLTYNYAHETMYIRAWYDSEQYIDSEVISIEIVPRQFTAQSSGGTVYPVTTLRLNWTTNFFPTKIQIGYRESRTGNWVSKVEITTGIYRTMSYSMSYDEAFNGTMYIQAFYGSEVGEWVSSEAISVVKRAAFDCGDNLTATLDANGVLTLTGAGPMYDYNTLNLPPWFSVSTFIKKIVIPDGVTYIGRTAFYNCRNLTQLDMTPSVTAIGNNAFLACSSLRSVSYGGFKSQWDAVDIGDNYVLTIASISYLHRSGRLGTTDVYYELIGHDGSLWIYGSGGSSVHVTPPWYDVAQYITEIRVDIDTLWEDAFRDCTGVKKVYLSEDLTLVDDGAFNDCTGLTDIYYDSTADDWDSIEILNHNAPLLSAALHTAPHEEQLTGDLSWSVNDEGLLRIWLDDDLMGDGEQTAIPDFTSYTAAPWYADYKDVITSLRIESGVTGIGRYAFSHLTKLRTIDIADTVTVIGNWSFSYCTSLEDFTLPDSVTRILAYTFQNCSYLETLHLPDSIQSMGNGVFQNCYNLEKVWLPSHITSILKNSFYNCSMLDMVSIPATVTSIGENAFYGCIELASSTGHVYYGGPSAQWKQIAFGTGNTQLLNCPNIHMTPEELRIAEANFPDAEFRGYVSTNIDADYSGWLTDEEIANVQTIYCGAINAETLSGIEYFTELEELKCVDNSLTELDLGANTKLVYLECQDNTITSLSLEALPGLYYLNCAGNQLTALDVSHQMLEALYCNDNQLTVLDLSGQALEFLDCRNNPLTLLDLSGQTQLEILSCYGTNLAALDLRGCTQLLNAVQYGTKTSTADYVQYQYVDNKLDRILRLRVDAGTELIVPGMLQIDEAHFPDEAFRLWVSDIADSNGSGWLSKEEIDATDAIYLNVQAFAELASVQGIEYFTGITELIIENTPNLTDIDLSANTEIVSLEITDTGLTTLDVSTLPALESLYCSHDPLTGLTLGWQPRLGQLVCCGTDLASLNISGAQHLIAAWLGTKESSSTEFDMYSAGEYTLIVDKDLSIITGIPAPTFTLPASLTAIEAEAFSGIAAEAVLIPAGLTSIQGDPFAGSSVRYIYGTTELARNFAQAYGYVFVPVRD